MKTAIVFFLFVMITNSVVAQQMKGYFEIAGLYGGIELVMNENNRMSLLLTVDGKTRVDTSVLCHKSGDEVSFSVVYDSLKVKLAFLGKRGANNISGTVQGNSMDFYKASGRWMVIPMKDSNNLQFLLPVPTGKYAVGKTVIHLKDQSRRERLSEDTSQPREIMASIWYPSVRKENTQQSSYFHDIDFLKSGFSSEQAYDKIKSLRGFSILDATTESSRQQFPVLIFSPGGGINVSYYTTLLEELCSHGYVVIGIDHTYEENATRLANGTVVKYNRDPQTDLLQYASQQIHQRYQDIEFVISCVIDGKQITNPLLKLVDKKKIGVFGHSRGGLAIGEVLLNDSRIKAAINYDGASLGAPLYGPSKGEYIRAPFVFFRRFRPKPDEKTLQEWKMSENESSQNFERIYSRAFSIIMSTSLPAYLITLDNATHMNFTDIPLLSLNANSKDLAQTMRLMRIIRHYTLSFFNCHLKGTSCKELKGFSNEFPEVSVQPNLN